MAPNAPIPKARRSETPRVRDLPNVASPRPKRGARAFQQAHPGQAMILSTLNRLTCLVFGNSGRHVGLDRSSRFALLIGATGS
ncbi:uncharacterized protein N7482_008994 [Penicillium canariense]|uniref:Uncharacterized protein n=1 Tax=Penicillium canariense TaxID=189055 RepID=A0A9W9HZH9_9EURO|nr:uncharacterized protein N7482_008994 [Penicillium canariense]KAJ5157894.1 hypothetical protein N7482_008994 [Penicillium canariense]